MAFLTEIVFYFFAIVIWLFASPIIFGVIGLSTATGSVGLVINAMPWIIMLVLIGRVIYVFRGGSSA